MTKLINLIKLIPLGILFLTGFIGSSQVMYKDQLETVYLNHKGEEVVYTNNFSSYNDSLISDDGINFRIEIRKAKEENSYLLFLSQISNLEVPKAGYLKTIRKGANRSTNVKAFENYLNDKLPELINQFRKDNNLEELYITSRKNTFNGKIDSLPSVLSIDF